MEDQLRGNLDHEEVGVLGPKLVAVHGLEGAGMQGQGHNKISSRRRMSIIHRRR